MDETNRSCSSLVPKEVILFRVDINARRQLHDRPLKELFLGVVLEIISDKRIVNVRYHRGSRELIEYIPFDDICGVYNKFSPVVRFGNTYGQFDILIPV